MKRALLSMCVGLAALANAQAGKIRSITLERTPCYGSCPVYTLTLNADGTAVYNGVRFVSRTGKYRGTFWVGEFDRMRPLLDKWGVWKLKPSYSTMATDQSTQILTIVTDKGKKTIREYGHVGPSELWALHTLVDGIGASVRDWEKAK